MMVEGTVEVTGTVKVDSSDELENLYQLARRANCTENNENAAKYYDMILIKDPTSWEANFYSVYFKSMGCKIADIPFLIMLLYAGLFVGILSLCSFWNWIYIKDIVIWVLFAGIPVCYGAANKTVNEEYFSSIVINNFKFAIIVEFIINTFTFSLITELLLQLSLFVLYALQVMAETKTEYKSTKKSDRWIYCYYQYGNVIFHNKKSNSYIC